MELTELPLHQETDRIKDNKGRHICYLQRPVGQTARAGMLISCERAAYIVRACTVFQDIEEGISMIVEKNHYYQLEAQAKSQPDLLAACEEIMRLRGDLLEGATSMDEGALLANGADAFDEIEAAIAKGKE